jgi:phage FluMu protein Com
MSGYAYYLSVKCFQCKRLVELDKKIAELDKKLSKLNNQIQQQKDREERLPERQYPNWRKDCPHKNDFHRPLGLWDADFKDSKEGE